MRRLQAERTLQIGVPLRNVLAGHAEDQVERNVVDVPAYAVHGAGHVVGLVIALQHPQEAGVERLGAEADAIDAVVGEDADLVVVEAGWVRLDGEFEGRLERQPAADHRQQRVELPGIRCVGVPPPMNSVRTGCGVPRRASSAAKARR